MVSSLELSIAIILVVVITILKGQGYPFLVIIVVGIGRAIAIQQIGQIGDGHTRRFMIFLGCVHFRGRRSIALLLFLLNDSINNHKIESVD